MASLNLVSKESRESFFESHAQLRAQSEAVGEELPEITREGVLAIAHEAVQSFEAEPVSHVQTYHLETTRVIGCTSTLSFCVWPGLGV